MVKNKRILWPTPKASEPGMSAKKGGHSSIDDACHLPSQVALFEGLIDENTGRLKNRDGTFVNPRWIECLMGVPVGWTSTTCENIINTCELDVYESVLVDLYKHCEDKVAESRLLGNGVVPNTAAKAFCVLLWNLNN